ncbi:cupin domain-containing protein [Nonomuraea sp. NPDC026600]|uniref:cupin domain-containing protein n=1 Tax=Nonomuraea sp. NPDC026600 TaxID=3155363 RepID=UPI0033C7DEF3
MSSKNLYRTVVRWDDLALEDVRPGVKRAGYVTDDVMLVMNHVEPGMALNPHVHEDFDQLAYIVSGRAKYYIDGVPHEMGPGSMLLVPAGSPHYIEPYEPTLNLDIFTPPRADLAHLAGYEKDLKK